jgi:hypothetical protein
LRNKGDQEINKFSDMRIVTPWCDVVTNMDYREDLHEEVVVNSLPLGNHSIVVTYSNLSNLSADVIHYLQLIGLTSAHTMVQQDMNFLSDSWTNMAQRDHIVDLNGNANPQFELVIP